MGSRLGLGQIFSLLKTIEMCSLYMGGVLNVTNCPSPRGTSGWSDVIVVGVVRCGGGRFHPRCV